METRYLDHRFEEIEMRLDLIEEILKDDIKDFLNEKEEISGETDNGKHTRTKPTNE